MIISSKIIFLLLIFVTVQFANMILETFSYIHNKQKIIKLNHEEMDFHTTVRHYKI